MIEVRGRWFSIMVLFAIALHLTWAYLILIDPAAVNATAIHALYRYIPSIPLLAAIMTGVAICAFVGLWTRVPIIVLLLMPQQIILMMSAAGYGEAVWLGQFADGVERSRSFIAADQLYCLLTAFGHTAAIIIHARATIRRALLAALRKGRGEV